MNQQVRARRVRPDALPADAAMVAQVRDAVLNEAEPVTGARLAAAVQSTGRLLGSEGAFRTLDRVRAELQGLGPLQRLAEDPEVTDILVNGPGAVWVDSGGGLQRRDLTFSSDADVRALATRLVAAGGRRLDDGNPCVDVRLDRFRVHAVLPPLSTTGTLLSIRIQRQRHYSFDELVSSGALDAQMASVLRGIVSKRLNFLISGATGTGKTTLLAALLSLSGSNERLVTVEDSAELSPAHPHAIGLQSRHGNLEGSGSVDLAELVRQALRMRPDRLIVGECRGAEVRELLAAMNTGHDGAGGTIHANSAASVPARLSALAALAGMEAQPLAQQAANALDVIVHVVRAGSGRTVSEVGVLERTAGGDLVVRTALARRGAVSERGPAWEALALKLERGR
ncbi:TadA family conjugal transfer-associated ATPase [Arthrobacter sp. EH-1B-1]|uniref:TadA family conjugal transfer-associated ATPase n=1 Tax=Arthrobacter vasquezii TaxID=2977629 RepID=A0ABT6CTE7_9MICC|nr:TadA family conjugal transfer-associated ATPase [Arthrobacter vasquezii]MDF9277175.1 TadA family conjugal transfer-associated ATPase [Arthrobacter vasquezii]